MKNLYLVQVVDNYGPNKFLPLAISYQWLYAQQDPRVKDQWQVCDVLIEKLNIKQWLDNIIDIPDLVAMSCYIWNWEYNRVLAQEIKSRWPKCVIVVGGPQVDKHDPAFARQHEWIDVAILGENESALRKILSNDDPQNWIDIPGVVTKQTTQVVQPIRTDDLDSIPSPILSGFYDWIMGRYFNKDVMWQVTYETMRGCPYHCAFCDIGDDYWNKIYQFDMDRIRREIEWMGINKIEYVSVCDSNWGITERDKDITQIVIDTKLKYGYPKVWDVTWAKNNPDRVRKIATMDHESKTRLFKGITFALQSLNPVSLSASKRFNLKPSTIIDSMAFFRKNDIPTYSEIIWPMPDETLDSLCSGLQELIDIGQKDFIMVHPLVLTPNAPMGQKDYIEKYKLLSHRVPLDTFWLKIDDPENYVTEMVDAVYQTRTVDLDITIQGHIISHWFVVLYYYGWAHAIMNYLYDKNGVKHIDFVEEFVRWANQNQDTLVGQEQNETQKSLRSVFTEKKFWGRKVNDNIYWEYKSATSVLFHHNRSIVNQNLKSFLKDMFYIDCPDLLDLNSTLCFDWRIAYPIRKKYDKEIVSSALGIESEKLIFDHWDISGIKNDEHFVHKAYHWQRKNRYWKCSVKPDE